MSLTVTNLEAQFNRPAKSVASATYLSSPSPLTLFIDDFYYAHFVVPVCWCRKLSSISHLYLVLSSRPQVIFGLLSDRYGRKWPLVGNLFLVSVLSLGTGFVKTFPQFLALRSLFGVGMGGIWGLASATALENLPVEARGIASGVMQQGYAVGYLIAALVNLYLVPHTTWRSLFWTGAGISAFAGFIRALLPESEVFLRAKQQKQDDAGDSTQSKTRVFFHEVKQMLKHHWKLAIYAVLLMTGFNFLSHGSQDLYPTYLQVGKGLSKFDSTVATIIGNCGAIAYALSSI